MRCFVQSHTVQDEVWVLSRPQNSSGTVNCNSAFSFLERLSPVSLLSSSLMSRNPYECNYFPLRQNFRGE